MAKILLILGLVLLGAAWAMRRRLNAPELEPEAEPAPLAAQKDDTATAMAEAFATMTLPALAGKITQGRAGLTESRIGGPLAWPVGQEPPRDDAGTPLALLAQVDLASLPQPLDLPRTGLLQVLIVANDQFGCAYPSRQGDGMRLVLHPQGTAFAAHPSPQSPMPFAQKHPTETGHPILWRALECPPSGLDYQVSDIFHDAPATNPTAAEAIAAAMDAATLARGSYDILLQGNPDFTQSDPREDAQFAGMVNLVAFSSTGGALMWGDSGEACFLIPPEDLKDANLSRVIYYWDCC
jgi:uncharacterized protein YwqG